MAGKNLFNSIKLTRPNSNVFDLSHDVKLSANMGSLIPTMVLDCVPGDKFNISQEALMRLAPMVAPMMHRVDVYFHSYFIPYRLVWPNWEKFITNTKDEISGLLPAIPYINVSAANYTPLCDYMGIPNPIAANEEKINVLAFAAFQCVYNEYYRDQNLIDPVDYKLSDGNNTAAAAKWFSMRKRAWEHDYFTSALPWAQKGDPVTIPLSGLVELVGPDVNNNPGKLRKAIDNTLPAGNDTLTTNSGTLGDDLTDPQQLRYDPNGTLMVNNAESTINDLRKAYRLQEWLEKAARGGSRYIESILQHFGVRSSDARLQRPEYITGSKSPVVISEVLQTGSTDETTPQGNMAGHGVSVTQGSNGFYRCEEHGVLMTIMSVMPRTAYQQGLPKMFTKTTDPFEWYWPEFANIGEQAVKQREVFAFNGDDGDDEFGYVPRYAEYKFENNRVAGDFRTTLNTWHMGRIFDSAPALSQEFVECDATHRVFAVTDPDEQKLYAHVANRVKAIRLMPKFGTPTF